ncbi:hypothetical protein CCR75_001941 [Bremia lactucae]|uniref:Uncharacterized protein n=1 Tax=Bremia lactucae TaxID=4779 RepID=A0A976IGU1_BRELC|nr:hypothetical protein CCR75_001941 [Bremia lactucae]
MGDKETTQVQLFCRNQDLDPAIDVEISAVIVIGAGLFCAACYTFVISANVGNRKPSVTWE